MRTRGAEASAVAGLGIGALVMATLIPVAPDQTFFPPPTLGLLVFLVGLGGLMLTFAATAVVTGARSGVAARLEAASLWGACGLAVLTAFGAVAVTAETLSLQNIVLAQQNTALFALRQPAAASVYVVALALAGQSPALRTVFGPLSGPRLLAESAVVLVLSALGATLFLGGFAGGWLAAPLWVLVKTLAVTALLMLARDRLAGLAHGPRLAIAWLAALVGFVNLAISQVLAVRQ